MDIFSYFTIAAEQHASDLHLIAGAPPVLRVDGVLKPLDGEKPLDPKVLQNAAYSQLLTPEQIKQFEYNWDLDFARTLPSVRLRINLRVQREGLALSARLIPVTIPSAQDIALPVALQDLATHHDGLVLVTGPSGCGKSTTLAVMLNTINATRQSHIITIEDPIEFVYERNKSIIEQREVGSQVRSFGQALKYALRQDPNVLLVGEMRDLETMSATLTAAETGHLVLSTLHTPNAVATLERVIDVFPPHQQHQVRLQLASSLRAVIAQQLLPRRGGGVVVAREVLLVNAAVANLIRENKIHQIISVMQTSGKLGMITMAKAVETLITQELLDAEDGMQHLRTLHTLS